MDERINTIPEPENQPEAQVPDTQSQSEPATEPVGEPQAVPEQADATVLQQEPVSPEPTDATTEQEEPAAASQPVDSDYEQKADSFQPTLNPVSFSPVTPVNDYKPMSRGLKIFSFVMAAIILLTGTCLAGYYVGKNSVRIGSSVKASKVDLAAKPKDTDEMTAAQVYDKANESIVGISVYNDAGTVVEASGIVYSKDGYILTNDHIYADIAAPKFLIYLSDGSECKAEYVAGDKISDLALLKISGKTLTPAVFGNSDELYLGQNVVAIGRPSNAATDSSITEGIVSALNKRVTTNTSYSQRMIQTDSPINPGSSGGALLNMYGQVVGITSSKTAGISYEGVSYAIPTTVMKRIVDELISDGKVVSRAKLGITYKAVNSVSAEINNFEHTGLYIASVSEDSDLYGKIAEGDFITQINGTDITSDRVVLDIIESCSAGDKLTVTAVTAKKGTQTFEIVLKANIGESSYSLTESNTSSGSSGGTSSGNSSGSSSGKSSGSSSDSSGSSSGGTFNFPFGE